MHKEIGSEFWNVPIAKDENHIFPNDTKWFISGRAAFNYVLKDIIKKNNVKSIAIPSWCCDTMLEPIIKNELDILFYSVTVNGTDLIIDKNIKADILLNLDYFGFNVNQVNHFNGIVINDVTHSVFVKGQNSCDYTFGSLRKWASFKTGGFAYCKNGFDIDTPSNTCNEYVSLRSEAMNLKSKYINGQRDDKKYLELFKQAEDMLPNLYDYSACDEDIYNARRLDVDFIRNKRQDNAKVLINGLSKHALFKDVKDNDCPLFVPIIVSDDKRDNLRKHLISSNIYCPVHWPLTNLHKINDDEKFIYIHELSLICDQRYNIEDMKLIVSKVKEFLGC